ncbi:helix-turn-helix domain-containing protein [Xylanibacter ruminicola]|uniref:DNA binding domain-containing protein, excisionase family n=1 Tax=Xylanibacter ruminicola TaxID=839 RepID=A0A1M6SE90_XYLRU|nr:DNA-directed RNA polymerase subunit alpha C-terminal domain-containing protein [Xylanibacter ruminicola]SHK43082.1 DNA binding domain-containing protein, excisionase family [Xylanibacter ruminicola]
MARLVTRQEAARLLNVSTQTVSNWIEKGYIKAHMLDNHLLVDRETIEQHFDSLQDLAHLEKTVKEKTEYLRKEDFNLEFEINDLLEARDRLKDERLYGVYRWIADYATRSADGMFTEQQQKIFHRMMDNGSADYIGKELGLSRSRVVDTFFNCLRKIAKVIDLAKTQEKWDEMEQENKRLKLQNASLIQQLNEYKANMAAQTATPSIPENEAKIKLLGSNFEEFAFSVRATNVLRGLGCVTMADVACLKKADLMNAKLCGKKTVEDIEKLLAEHGLSLGSKLQLLMHPSVK